MRRLFTVMVLLAACHGQDESEGLDAKRGEVVQVVRDERARGRDEDRKEAGDAVHGARKVTAAGPPKRPARAAPAGGATVPTRNGGTGRISAGCPEWSK
jgi:hypothetical protein